MKGKQIKRKKKIKNEKMAKVKVAADDPPTFEKLAGCLCSTLNIQLDTNL